MYKIIFIIALIVICSIEIFIEKEKPMQRLFREINTTNREVSMTALEKLNFLSATEKKEFVTILLHEAKKDEHYFTRMGFLNLLQRYKLVNADDHQFVIPILLFIKKDAHVQLVKRIFKLMQGSKTHETIIHAYKTNIITFALAAKFLQENHQAMITLVNHERKKTPRDVNKIAVLAIHEQPDFFDELLLIYNDNIAEKKQITTIFLQALKEDNLDENQALRVLKILSHIIPQEQTPQLLTIMEQHLENNTLLFATVSTCAVLPYRTNKITTQLKKLIQNNATKPHFVNVDLEIYALIALLRTDSSQAFATEIFTKKMRKNHRYARLILEKTTEDTQVNDICLQWLQSEKENVPPLVTEYLSQKQHKPALATFVEIADELVFLENKYYLCLRILSALSKYKNQKSYITEKFIQYLGETKVRPIVKCQIISYMRDMGVTKIAAPALMKLHSESVDTKVLVHTQMTLKELGYTTKN